ncbi:helicase associated domain-containing protein [Fulvivirgaceae bacterium BMA10]|uniref:Helicase associated domain-containing protein n=1 Tax=Splendidivirga corallicola TaxID=3051826 RepID=A0ABT8KP00_9BACT|nr:helicase associated domain-containing protein [Fulvivirgaceae bacterium BMA10]
MLFDQNVLKNWNANFKKLQAYEKKYGHCNVSASSKRDAELAHWVTIQRRTRQHLPHDLRAELLKIGFDFFDDPQIWDKRYKELQNFRNEHGHVYLPTNSPKYADLLDWLIRQIRDRDYLVRERIKLLDALGVEWEHKSSRDWRWQEMYRRLVMFKKKHGHCQVPQKWEEDLKLSNWVCVQRRRFGIGKLTEERKELLNKIGFVWSFKDLYNRQWEEHFELLQEYKNEFGHCRIPLTNKVLGGWIDRQRIAKVKGKLGKERKQKLNEIGFVWNFKEINDQIWEEKFQLLAAFKNRYGHCFVPVNWKENKSLGNWVATQRRLEETAKISKSRKKRLEDLGFVWRFETNKFLQRFYDAKWEENYKNLIAYFNEHGSLQVSVEKDPSLQRWTCLQRSLYHEGKLAEDRIKKLENINFAWNLHESYWMKMYEELVKFKAKYGHTKVPWMWEENPQLAPWVNSLKVTKDNLEIEKIALLDKIQFDWEIRERNIVPWEEMYNLLLEFKKRFGHTKVPVYWQENYKLGKWAARMRSERYNLPTERIKLLEAIKFEWGKKRESFDEAELVPAMNLT